MAQKEVFILNILVQTQCKKHQVDQLMNLPGEVGKNVTYIKIFIGVLHTLMQKI